MSSICVVYCVLGRGDSLCRPAVHGTAYPHSAYLGGICSPGKGNDSGSCTLQSTRSYQVSHSIHYCIEVYFRMKSILYKVAGVLSLTSVLNGVETVHIPCAYLLLGRVRMLLRF